MCGRFQQGQKVAEWLKRRGWKEWSPGMEVTEGMTCVAVPASGEPMEAPFGWVAEWNDRGGRMVNARLETMGVKPFWRDAAHNRRCVIPVEGWRERTERSTTWATIRPKNVGIVLLAGIWNTGGVVIVTCNPCEALSSAHPRQPAIAAGDGTGWTRGASLKEAQGSLVTDVEGGVKIEHTQEFLPHGYWG